MAGEDLAQAIEHGEADRVGELAAERVSRGGDARRARRRGRADVGLVGDHDVRSDLVQDGAQIRERAAGQYVAEHDHADAPSLRARSLAQSGVVAQGELVRLVDRDARAHGAEPRGSQPRQELLAGAEDDLVPGIAARHRQRQERVEVPVCRTAGEQDPHARSRSHAPHSSVVSPDGGIAVRYCAGVLWRRGNPDACAHRPRPGTPLIP
jgi:hypothetical protein